MKSLIISTLLVLLPFSLTQAEEQRTESPLGAFSITLNDKDYNLLCELKKKGDLFSGISEDQEDGPPIEWGEYITSELFKRDNGSFAISLTYKIVYEPKKNPKTGSVIQESKSQLFIVEISKKKRNIKTFNGKILSIHSSLVDKTGQPIKNKANKSQ